MDFPIKSGNDEGQGRGVSGDAVSDIKSVQ